MSNLDHPRIREKKKAKKGEKECETYHLVQSNSINMDSEGAIEIKCPYQQGVCIKWLKFRENVRAFFQLSVKNCGSSIILTYHWKLAILPGGKGEGGVLQISSDRDNHRIFLCSKFSISGFLGVGKFWKVFFWVA